MSRKLFNTGYSAVKEEKERQERNRERIKGKLWDFYLSDDGDEAQVRFLTEEPVNYYAHSVPEKGGRYQEHICTQDDDCEYCNEGDKPQFKSAYLIWDKREYETTNEKGKKVKKSGCLRLYTQGTKVTSQLARISSKSGITVKDLNIVRSGKGTQTSYMFENDFEREPLTADEVREMLAVLPEEQQDMYKGDVKKGNKSLLDVVMAQLEMRMDDYDEDEDKLPFNEDEDYDESDGEEDETPRRSSKSSARKTSKKSTPTSSSKRRRYEEDEDEEDDDYEEDLDEEEDEDSYYIPDEDEEEDDFPMNSPRSSRRSSKSAPAKRTPAPKSNKGRSKGLFRK